MTIFLLETMFWENIFVISSQGTEMSIFYLPTTKNAAEIITARTDLRPHLGRASANLCHKGIRNIIF